MRSTEEMGRDMGRLSGKTIVVTGAVGTIGRVAAQRFSEEGANLVLVDLHHRGSELTTLAEELNEGAESVIGVEADISEQDQIDAAFSQAVDRFGGVDGVFANAGVITRAPIDQRLQLDDEAWQKSLSANITGTWRTLRAASGPLRRRGGGSIVITSSIAGIRGGLNNAAYSAAKHAVIGIGKTAAHDLGKDGIRVNWVLPTGVKSEMFLRPERVRQARPDLTDPSAADAAQVWSSTNLLGVPWVEAVDVANATLFLLSDEARYLTAVGLPIDAGQSQLNPFAAVEGWLHRE